MRPKKWLLDCPDKDGFGNLQATRDQAQERFMTIERQMLGNRISPTRRMSVLIALFALGAKPRSFTYAQAHGANGPGKKDETNR